MTEIERKVVQPLETKAALEVTRKPVPAANPQAQGQSQQSPPPSDAS